MCLSDHNSAKKKSSMTSPTLAAYETFEMDFDLGKKYGRLLTKNKLSSSKDITRAQLGMLFL